MIEGDPQPTWPGIDKSKNNATKFSGIPIGFRSYSFNPADGGVQWDHASYSAGWWSSTQGVMGEGYCAVVRGRTTSVSQRTRTSLGAWALRFAACRIDLTRYFFSGSAYAGPLFFMRERREENSAAYVGMPSMRCNDKMAIGRRALSDAAACENFFCVSRRLCRLFHYLRTLRSGGYRTSKNRTVLAFTRGFFVSLATP